MGGKQAGANRVGPEQPVSVAARSALALQLQSVNGRLKLAAIKSRGEPEDIHQLRVATRRAAAALELFRDLCPRKKTARLQKQLRRIRRAAGPTRDLDVLIERLQCEDKNDVEFDYAKTIRKLQKYRREAYKKFRAECRQIPRKRFQRLQRQLLERVRWRDDADEPMLGDSARCRLTPRIDDFFAAGSDLPDLQSLHELRIRCKRLRYSLEILGNAFSKSDRKKISAVIVGVQDQLGELNDYATAAGLFEYWMHRCSGSRHEKLFAHLLKTEQERIDDACGRFREWWSAERVAELRARLGELLVSSSFEQTSDGSERPLISCTVGAYSDSVDEPING